MRLWLFCAAAGMLLGSAAPPPSAPIVVSRDGMLQPSHFPAPLQPAPAQAKIPSAPVLPAAAPEPELPNIQTETLPPPRSSSGPTGPVSDVRVVISLPQQKLYVFRDGELLATSPVSTGKPGHETPVGTFPISQKKVHHHSNRYDNAPMPYMQRLTSYGIAIHAGALPGYPASHGCIRVPRSFAKTLYGITDFGTRVTITRARPKSWRDALELA